MGQWFFSIIRVLYHRDLEVEKRQPNVGDLGMGGKYKGKEERG